MPEYLRKIDHATSVKEIHVLQEPTKDQPGIADFKYRPVFSVFDYGTIKPPVHLDNSTVNLMLGYNFELLKEHGIDSHYLCLVTDDGQEITAKEAISRGIAPTTARVMFANRVMPKFEKGKWDYTMYNNGETNCYVQPIEFISRNGLPEGSSVWKRVREGQTSMKDLGLPEDFKPGDKVPNELIPILDYSTKFEPDDRYLTPEQARLLMNISPERFAAINQSTTDASNIMTNYAESRGFKRHDGKIEQMSLIINNELVDVIADAVCTWHEDRLVTPYGVGISKQRIRNKIKKLNPAWYEDIQRAKKEAIGRKVQDFRTLMNPDIKYTSPSPEFFEAINNLFRAGTNQWVGARVYQLYPEKCQTLENDLERAVEEFQKVA